MPKLSNLRFSNYALDNFVAPQLSELTQCGIPNIASRWDQSEHWIANFILNSILRVSIDSKPKQYIIFFLRRSESAIREYNAARLALLDYVSKERERVSVYFKALFHIENCIAQMWQAFAQTMYFMKNEVGEERKVYQKGDGSPYESLNKLYNTCRYAGDNIAKDSNLPIWLTNEGVDAKDSSISFVELAALLGELCDFADKLSNQPVPTPKRDDRK